ncbi:STAS domain-containing protein [Serinibacter salmoneus]|uniref:Anti-sigma factor antagonist n=1 Tax=Serinibacter salmoneus TaxID=556530 RepID=A0A2A9D4P3_9MICO|nr:STAS domain-containing protein [Serinibacter salmoneus]PFG20820.1 anti-anti-sigma factor [Serinibacter salmoneus]
MDTPLATLRPTPSAEVHTSPSHTILTLRGEIDAASAPDFAAAVTAAEQAARPTTVHAGAVTFMDSSGIALLARLATRTPGRLRLVDPPEVVQFLLSVTRIGDMVEIVAGGDSAT